MNKINNTNWIIALIVTISGLMPGAVTSWAADKAECKDEAHFPLISKKELTEVAQAKTAVIIDVNSKESFKKVHVPGAFHYETHHKDFAKMLPTEKDKLIVAYCGGTKCGAWHKAAEEACELGYTNIRHFKEGIQGWVAKN